jgi:hypothetical protein
MNEVAAPAALTASPRASRPYPGFRPFRRNEWQIFFGRDGQIEALLNLLANRHFICIHGPSGCGKSSLIEAGLMATLDREARRFGTAWHSSMFRPGTSPLWNLARGLVRAIDNVQEPASERVLETHARLTRPGGSIAVAAREAGLGENENLLLVADQFEELFRFRELGNAIEARRFVELLLGVFDQHPPGVHVAIAMRSDFLGDCSSMIGLAEAVNAAPYLTPALTEQELRDAISGPADMFGGEIQPDVVEAMLRDSASELDRLPLLQHTLMRCWDQAAIGGSPIHVTMNIYRSEPIGGVQNALNRHANTVMAGLAGREGLIELMFRSLAEVDSDGRAIRRAVPWGQLCAEIAATDAATQANLLAVVDAFRDQACGFLGRPPIGEPLKPDSIVDVAHEALIRRWEKMSDPPLAARGSTVTLPRRRSGWLWEQLRDAQIYRDLINRIHDEEGLPGPLLADRSRWWQAQPRTSAWARRMGGDRQATEDDVAADLKGIDTLFERSRVARDQEQDRRRRGLWLKRVAIATSVALGVSAVGIVLILQHSRADLEQTRADLAQEKARQETAAADQQEVLRVAQQRDLRRVQEELDATKDKLAQATQALAMTAGAGGGETAPLAEQKTELAKSDITNAAALAAPAASDGNAGCDGAIWVGSEGAFNLRPEGGSASRPFEVANVREGATYIAATDIRLRRTLPDSKTGQGEAIGVVPKGAQVTALGTPVVYRGSNSPQYWMKVRVASQVCSVVYFQFAGPPESATVVSNALKAHGYAVPSAELLRTAAGLGEVRYYYPDDEKRARQLAEATDSALAKLPLGKRQNIKAVGYTNWDKNKKPPMGTLELWLDLSPPASAK